MAWNLDPLVERSGADLGGRSLDRLDWADEPASKQDAGGNRQQQERNEQKRGAPDRRLERRKRLTKRFFDEDTPAERLDRLERAQDLRPILITPDRHCVGGGLRGRT